MIPAPVEAGRSIKNAAVNKRILSNDTSFDGFVKSLKTSFGVIPAKAEIKCFQIVLDACLRRHDGISDFLRVCQFYVAYME